MKQELNVLIIDDSDEDAILVMRELTRVYNAIHERVKSSEELSVALGRRKWDIVVCDYIIPGFSAFAAIEMVKKSDMDVPFIVVSGKVEEEIAVEVMKAGACDYVLKDKLGRLLSVVKRELEEAAVRSRNRAIQKELEEIDERYRDICENANDIIFVAKAEGRILYANPSLRKLTGYSAEELGEMKINDIIHPESAAYWQSVLERVTASRKSEKVELSLRTKKKDEVYVEGDCGAKTGGDGKLQIRGIFHDITEKKISDEMRDKYKAIVNTSSELMSMVNREYAYEAVNDAYCAAQGMKREQILGKTVADIWGKKVFSGVLKEHIDKCFLGHKIKYREWIEFPSLGKKYHEVSLYPYLEKGVVVNAVISTQDITELDKAESKRKQYIDSLTFLSRAAMGFIELAPENDMYSYIASCLKELVPDSIVLTCAFSKETSEMKITSTLGLGENVQKVMDIVGPDFINKTYLIDQGTTRLLTSGKLLKIEGGLHELSYGTIPKISCKMIERLLNITCIYAMGFSKKGELFGDAKLIMKHELEPEKKAMIETFINQASVAVVKRNAERDLKNSEERMRILFEFAPDAYALCDAEGLLVDCNRSFKKMTGYRKEEVLNKRVMDLIIKKSETSEIKNNNATKEQDSVFQSEEYVIHSKNGTELIAEVTRYPLRINRMDSGLSEGENESKAAAIARISHTHTLIIIRDITERKRFVEEIRRLAKFVYENPEPMMRISREGRLIYANPASIKILGEMKFEIDKTVPKQWFDMVAGVISSGKKISTDQILKDRIYSFEVVPLVESGYVNLYGRDITENERSEKALRESEEKYRTLFEDSKDMVYISTPEGRYIDINRAGIELLGYETKQDVMKMDLQKDLYMHPEDRKKMLTLLDEQNYVKDFETIIKRKDGRALVVLLTSTPVRGEKGVIKEIRGIIKDITERRNMEAQLAQLQKMESLGMLAGGIAHDFNNLLTGIIGNVSFLKKRLEGQNEFTDDIIGIEESAKSAAGLTGQLLAFARGGKYNISVINLSEIAMGTLKIISRMFDRKIKIRVNLSESIPCIEADPVQIGQVLMNLCVNARDALPKGGELFITTGSVSLTSEDVKGFIEAKPGEYVSVSVADTGTGMDKETSRRIFEPFFTTKGVGSGTGLGLSVVYGIVKNHGGFLNVRSEPGKGSEFTVYLPASVKSRDKIVNRQDVIIRGSGETVLVVDDEKEIRLLVKRILENNGYKVLVAQDGDEALKLYKDNTGEISLVILDMMMPKADGEELFLKMKAIRKEVKILIATGYSDSEKTNKMLRDGAKGVIQKPFNMESLLSYIRVALDSK